MSTYENRVVLNSRFREDGSPTEFHVHLDGMAAASGAMGAYVVSAHMPNFFTNLNGPPENVGVATWYDSRVPPPVGGHNLLWIAINGMYKYIYLPPGQYTVQNNAAVPDPYNKTGRDEYTPKGSFAPVFKNAVEELIKTDSFFAHGNLQVDCELLVVEQTGEFKVGVTFFVPPANKDLINTPTHTNIYFPSSEEVDEVTGSVQENMQHMIGCGRNRGWAVYNPDQVQTYGYIGKWKDFDVDGNYTNYAIENTSANSFYDPGQPWRQTGQLLQQLILLQGALQDSTTRSGYLLADAACLLLPGRSCQQGLSRSCVRV
jgi:hypothetical protein